MGKLTEHFIRNTCAPSNLVAAVQCIKSCRYGSGASVNIHRTIRLGTKCELSDFDDGMIVGVISADLLGFSKRDGAKNKKHSVRGSSACGNTLLMRVVNREWPDWFELTERLR